MTELADLPQIDMLVSDEAHRRYAQLRSARLATSPNGFLSFLHYDDAFSALGNLHLRPMALEEPVAHGG